MTDHKPSTGLSFEKWWFTTTLGEHMKSYFREYADLARAVALQEAVNYLQDAKNRKEWCVGITDDFKIGAYSVYYSAGERVRTLLTQSAADALDEYVQQALCQRVGEQFVEASKYLQAHGYGDWDGTANGQTITLTGCANMMREYVADRVREEERINVFVAITAEKYKSVYAKVRNLITQMQLEVKNCMLSRETGDCVARNIVEDWTDQLSAILPPAEEIKKL